MTSYTPETLVYYEVVDYFHYWPNKGLNIAALAVFPIATLLCLAATVLTRRWYMLVAVAVGIMEIMGYAFRLVMRTDPVYGYYVAMQCLLIIPPSFLALCQYVTLAKVVKYVKDSNPDAKLFLKPALITWLYFAFEIFSLALQGAGAGLSLSDGGDAKTKKRGKNLLIIGLAFLVVLIVCFLANAVFVSVRKEYGVWQSRQLTYLFSVLYFTSLLLLIRNAFRLIEFADGWDGSIARQEKLFYGFDTLLVLLILFFFSVFHYGFFLNGYEKEKTVKSSPAEIQMV